MMPQNCSKPLLLYIFIQDWDGWSENFKLPPQTAQTWELNFNCFALMSIDRLAFGIDSDALDFGS